MHPTGSIAETIEVRTPERGPLWPIYTKSPILFFVYLWDTPLPTYCWYVHAFLPRDQTVLPHSIAKNTGKWSEHRGTSHDH